MQRLITAASVPGEATSLGLVDFLRSRPWPVKIFQKSTEALRTAGRLEAARDVLAVASAAFPASASIEDQKREVARLLAAQLAANPAPVAASAGNLPGEKIFFQRLGDLLRDEQWALVEPLIPVYPGGRPRKTPLRDVLDAIFYLWRTGCQWRYIPRDLPARSTLHGYLDLWNYDCRRRRGSAHRRRRGLPGRLRGCAGCRSCAGMTEVYL